MPPFDLAVTEKLIGYFTGPVSALLILIVFWWFYRKDRLADNTQSQENFETLVATFTQANERLHSEHRAQTEALCLDKARCEQRLDSLHKQLFGYLNKTGTG